MSFWIGHNLKERLIDKNLDFKAWLIPTKFKIPTILYTRLDLDIKSIVEQNYNRKNIAEMKKMFSENDFILVKFQV